MKCLLMLAMFVAIPINNSSANKNIHEYYQVPKNELIIGKAAAAAPLFFSNTSLKGKGFLEPFINAIINEVKEKQENVYTDYFTQAKTRFYMANQGYEICALAGRPLHHYRLGLKKTKLYDKEVLFSYPLSFSPAIGLLGYSPKKRNIMEKHFWPGTQVFKIQTLIDDPDLYTVNLTGSGNMLSSFIYEDPINGNLQIKKKYQKRVYDFVASEAYQIPLMLKGKRMDYADLSMSDYYIKKFKIGNDSVILAPVSSIHPKEIVKDDIMLRYIVCVGKEKEKIEKRIKIINSVIKKYRTDLIFWQKVLKQFALDQNDPNIPYQAPEDFHFTKTMVEYKKMIDDGNFDY